MIDRVHGGDIKRYFGKIPERGRSAVIDFSANINPLGLSPKAKEAIIKNIAGTACYPEPDSKSLKKALSDFHGIREDSLTTGNGSIELIYLIPKALGSRKALVITPTFSEYEFALRAAGAKIIFFRTREEDGFRPSLDKLKSHLSWADLVFLCNPNNPTGSSLAADELSSLVKACVRHKTILAIDEVFMDFVEGPDEGSLIPRALEKHGLLIIRSLTKFFAMPGLRIGYMIGHRELVRRISRLQYPWNVNSLAQVAGEAVLEDADYMERTRRYVWRERRYLFNALKDIKDIKVFPSTSNFIFCKLEGSIVKSARALNKRLIKKRMMVRNCDNFRGLNKNFFRIAVRRRQENLKLIAALKEALL